ncbi:hypothetical protein Daus18300_011972 [Diaporthe australafricana]|uniref:Altered inheritance of mitochondria protein 9, mitochondrial n=1 Tax=Diaporthe australafricana TaxID=127596 RepID=A0ABR3W4I7_9PEZI
MQKFLLYYYLLDTGISRIPDKTPQSRPAFRGTTEEHVALLSKAGAVLEALSRDPRIEKVSSPLLLHPDLHKRNIFVDPDDPTKITAIIDWQSTCIDPALLYFAEVPDLCEHPGGVAHDALDFYNESQTKSPEEVEMEDRLQNEVDLLRTAWEIHLAALSPRLGRSRSARILSYQPIEEELAEHIAQWEDFETELKLKKGMMKILFTDEEGSVYADNWEVVKEASDALFEKWLVDAEDEIGLEKAKQLWPFDHRA